MISYGVSQISGSEVLFVYFWYCALKFFLSKIWSSTGPHFENPRVFKYTPKLVFREVQYSEIIRALYLKTNTGGDYDQNSSKTQKPRYDYLKIAEYWTSWNRIFSKKWKNFFEEIFKILNKNMQFYKNPKFSLKFFFDFFLRRNIFKNQKFSKKWCDFTPKIRKS